MRTISLLLPLLCLAVSAHAEPPAPKILGVGAISINPCQDAKVLADWYARLGFATQEFHGMYFAKIETPTGELAFAIHAKKADAPARSSASVAIVFRVENFEEALAAVRANGLVPATIEKDDFGQFAHFHDPDGNAVTLWAE